MARQIVNIVNFIRGCEPRIQTDLLMPVKEQIKLLKEHNLPGTFLIQYDAMILKEYQSLLKSLGSSFEIGIWFEMNQPLVERAGLSWRGRPGWPWDYHPDVGFTVGYLPEDRKKIIDILFEEFKKTFGYYPSTVGSWFIDAISLQYMHEKYKITASCNCKDQWGTDGYTLWGGYYGQAYYPSRMNMLSPAQTIQQQIDVPIFRMLGSDPIYQYDAGSSDGGPSECQPVVTLEPAYTEGGGGGDPNWVDWFLKENFNGLCLSFGYAQAGQENSFGWESMQKGLTYQIECISKLQKDGKLTVETMKQTGSWYKNTYFVTPASSIVADSDWKGNGARSAWYCSKNYRANLFFDMSGFKIRDLFLFDEAYSERYLDARCDSNLAVYDNLPLMDGNRWSGMGVKAGIRLILDQPDGGMAAVQPQFAAIGHEQLEAGFSTGIGRCRIICDEGKLTIEMEKSEGWQLEMGWSAIADVPFTSIANDCIVCSWNSHPYCLKLAGGRFEQCENAIRIIPENRIIQLIPYRA